MSKPFPAEGRRDVIASFTADLSIAEIQVVRPWVVGRRADRSTPGSPMTPAAAASVEQRLPNLDKRNRQREQENEVLRRATA